MDLLVSDYDNTFHIKDIDMKKNVEKANNYMNKNLFVIATGRSYSSYKEAEKQFNINTHYTILNHGGTILKGDNVIYDCFIDTNIKDEIIKLIHLEHALHVECYSSIYEVDINHKNITKIRIEYDDNSIVPEIFQLINKNYSNKLKIYLFTKYNSIEITSINIDKSYAVDYIVKLENPDNIYVIGDNYNDYLMIKKYNGSCTWVAVDKIKEISQKEYQNVSDFIEEIERSK